ncbi:MAG TPA: hypothetical protein VEP90_25020 [Methylomirabilota bacterium]|nr:hypothetical protein [Methylomirabilota bacterium]
MRNSTYTKTGLEAYCKHGFARKLTWKEAEEDNSQIVLDFVVGLLNAFDESQGSLYLYLCGFWLLSTKSNPVYYILCLKLIFLDNM